MSLQVPKLNQHEIRQIVDYRFVGCMSRDVERGLFTVGGLGALDSTVSEVYNCNQLMNVAQTKVRQMALV